jgi:ubiquinone biosynthesis protein
MGGTTNDIRMQLSALCDMGALPKDVDIEAVISELNLEGPVKDPTLMSPDELVAEIRELTKSLLAYGARMPKELMLFVKDLLFLDGAIATLAPDIDLFAEITEIATYFATHHGDRIMADVGIDPRALPVNLDGIRGSMGLTAEVESITYRDLQARREIIRKRMEERHRRRH